MKMSIFEKGLGLEYINNYIRKKGLASYKDGETSLSFKLYDLNWSLFFEDTRLRINVNFGLGEDTNMVCMMKAMNEVNNNRYIVKVFVDQNTPTDESGNPIKDAETSYSIVFSFETFCFTESSFDKVYEFCVYAMTDAIEFHRKQYAQYLESTKTTNRDVKIGFTREEEKQDTSDASKAKNTSHRIGFIQ